MSYIEQFILSLTLQFKKVVDWRNQNIWKTILYVLSLIIIINFILFLHSLLNYDPLKNQLEYLPETFVITESGAAPFDFESLIIEIPIINSLLILGNLDYEGYDNYMYNNIIIIGETNWSYTTPLHSSIQKNSYRDFPFFNVDLLLTKEEIIQLAEEADKHLKSINLLHTYIKTFIDIILHFLLITIFAIAGFSFKRIYSVYFKEAFTITSYGITAPIILRTFVNLSIFNIPLQFTLYWFVVGLFSILAIYNIDTTC